MADYLGQTLAAQKKVQDLLATQSAGIDPGIAKSQAVLASRKQGYQNDVGDLLGAVGSSYGISPSIVSTGSANFAKAQPGVDRVLQEQLDRRRMAEHQHAMTTTYNTAYNNLVQSGMDLNTANDRARQIAFNQRGQDFQAAENARQRKAMIEQQNQKNSYEALQQSYANKKPDIYEQQVIASLLNLGIQAPLAYGLYKSNQPPVATSTPKPVAGQSGNVDSYYDRYAGKPTITAGVGGY